MHYDFRKANFKKKMQSLDECFAIIGSVEGIVPKFCFYCSIIIFWMAMGCGVACLSLRAAVLGP